MAESFFEFREKMTSRGDAAPAPAGPPRGGSHQPLTVSQLTRQIDRVLKDHLPTSVLVKGEISNVNAHGSGHLYFTLKDADACIDCVMWRSDAARLRFEPDGGMELLVSGHVKVYAQRGRYQLYAASLQPLGQGALELAFQQLRKKLDGEGLFAAERKKPIPPFPRRIALVTGGQAAALHDMLKVLRRFRWLKVFVYPIAVQGAGAGAQVADALKHLARQHKKLGGIDVILLGRGGGSLEDLWAFNEEAVARAVAASSIPVVTGIGHEVDVSIADLVADYHAHTPTEAAQVVTANWKIAPDIVDGATLRLRRGLRTSLQDARRRLEGIERHELFRRPMDGVNQLRQRVDEAERGLRVAMNSRVWNLQRDLREIEESLAEHSPRKVVRELREDLADVRQRLQQALARRIRVARQRTSQVETLLAARHPRNALQLAAQRLSGIETRLRCDALIDRQRRLDRLNALQRELRAVSPESVLRRGFSMTTLKNGTVVRSAAQIKGGETLITRLSDGSVESTAEDPKQPKLFD